MTILYLPELFSALWNKSCTVRAAHVCDGVRISASGSHPEGEWPPARAITSLSREEIGALAHAAAPNRYDDPHQSTTHPRAHPGPPAACAPPHPVFRARWAARVLYPCLCPPARPGHRAGL